ncbi:MAG TPA: nucleoside deaminase [Alphaproteobacteria bacterium]|nr:nucleoside deaminase [Alphaproteobacteria bacterium]
MQAENKYMMRAQALAAEAAALGEIPVGAVLVDSQSGEIVAEAHNLTERDSDATAHAEIIALRAGGAKKGSPRLSDCDLYVTLEPCAMCAAAISFARIRRLYFGAYDPKGGGVENGTVFYSQPTCHHRPEVYGGIHEQDCAQLLKDFFKDKRT